MSVNLIPQDKLTLELLAEILAKMYRHSLNDTVDNPKVKPASKLAARGGFSAHGDKNEMLRFLKESGLRVKKIAVVHGEEDQSVAFGKFLNENGFNAVVPKVGESIPV